MDKINDIIENIIDETNLRNNRDVLAFILYGSYLYKTNSDISDVDILIVLNGHDNYRIAKMIDGLHFDIHALSIPEIEKHIVYERASGNQYIESVLRNGYAFINKELTVEYLKSLLTVNCCHLKRMVSSVFASLAVDKAEDFLDNNVNDDYSYFIALEALRKVIHVKLNASDIPELKVYKLYTNPELSSDKYIVKLPNKDFRGLYMEAIAATDLESRRKYIVKLLTYLVGTDIRDDVYVQKDVFDDNRMKGILISLNHLVITAEDNIINNTPYANALYYLTLERIMGAIERVYGVISSDVQEIFARAVKCASENERINAIEELFHVVDSKYKIDYDDFILKL